MNTFKRKILNQAAGIIPIFVFLVAQNSLEFPVALSIGIVAYITFLALGIYTSKPAIPYMSIVVGLVFFTSLLLLMETPLRLTHKIYVPIIFEACFLLFILLIRMFKQYLRLFAVKKDRNSGNKLWLNITNEFLYVLKLYKNIFFIYFLSLIIYEILPPEYRTKGFDQFIFYQLNAILVFGVIIYEYIRLGLIRKQFGEEDWLPVVNESGKVIGKIAMSVSRHSKQTFLHPVVRIAFIYRGMLYLMERPSEYVVDPGKIDHPFEKYVRFRHELDEAVKNILKKRCGFADLPYKFIFRYLYKNGATSQLIYLYVVQIHNEELMEQLNFDGGKLWTEKQIEENLNTGVFFECFEKEYEILKNTILYAEHLANEKLA